ncbi:MAG: hypothetical protein GEU92_05870 [Alphaproteobacteria bacterium]|nr:hypothetical protein [Alphaproteobacteria bacterium]
MKRRIDGELVFAAALVAFIAAMLIATLQFPPLLRYTPFIAGGLTLVFLGVLIAGTFHPGLLRMTETALQDMWGGGNEGQKFEEAAEAPSPWRSVLRVMGYAVGFLLAVYWFGFFLVTPIFIAIYLTLDAKARPLTALAVAAGLSVVLIFALVNLNVDLWVGRIPEIVPDYIGGAIEPQF